MKRFFILAILAISVLLAQTPAQQVARRALDLLLAEKFPELSAMFSKVMKESLPEESLRSQVGGEVRRLENMALSSGNFSASNRSRALRATCGAGVCANKTDIASIARTKNRFITVSSIRC